MAEKYSTIDLASEYKEILQWVVVSHVVVLLGVVSTLCWVLRNTSTVFTLQFGSGLFFTAFVCLIDTATSWFAMQTGLRDAFLLTLFTSAFSLLIFAVALIMNLLAGVLALARLLLTEDESTTNNRSKTTNNDLLPNYVYVLLISLFGYGLIALINLVSLLTVLPLAYPQYSDNFKLFLSEMVE